MKFIIKKLQLMKNIKIILLTVLIVTSCVVTYLNFLRYESFKIQFEMAIDRQYNKDYSARDIDWINSIKTSYPSLDYSQCLYYLKKGNTF